LPPARGAVGVGAVSPHAGDYHGPLVNLLARLVKAGGPGELVVTREAAAALPPDRWSLRALEPTALRRVDETVRTFVVTPIVV
jgi:class 3 adenylate cyclase